MAPPPYVNERLLYLTNLGHTKKYNPSSVNVIPIPILDSNHKNVASFVFLLEVICIFKIDKTIPKYNIFDEAVIQFVEAVSKASFYS